MATMVPIQLSECDKELVNLAKRLVSQFNIPIKVSCVEDIDAAVFVTLYEGLYGDQLPGIIRRPETREDEIHNCQVVIDSLSKDVLHISLSHIRGPKIIGHCRENISNLLEIFSGLSDYILTRIESDGGYTDNEDVRSIENGLEDPDIVNSEIIDDFLERELSQKKLRDRSTVSPTTKKTADYINNQLQNTNRQSPGLDSTEELIREGEKWEAKLCENNQRISDKSPNQFDKIGQRRSPNRSRSNNGQQKTSKTSPSHRRDKKGETVRQGKDVGSGLKPASSDTDVRHTFTHHLYHYYDPPPPADASNESMMSASLPMRLNPQPEVANRMRATIATPTEYDDRHFRPVSSQSRESPGMERLAAKGLASSYDNLQNLVETTATLARTAVKTSPVKSRAERDLSYLLTSPRTRPVQSKSSTLEDRDLARDMNKTRSTRPMRDVNMSANSSNDLSPGRSRRKVSFLQDRSSSTDSGSPYREQRLGKGAPNVSLDMKRKQERLSTQQRSSHDTGKYGSYTDNGYLSDREVDSDTASELSFQQRFNEIVDDVLSTDSDQMLATKKKRRPAENNRQVHFEKMLTKTGKGSLAATRQQLRKETKKATTVSDYLKKVYAEDYEDMQEQVEGDLRNSKEKVKELDQALKKKTVKKVRKPSVTATRTSRGLGANKLLPLSKPVSTKVRKCSSSSSGILPRKTMLTVHDEEELLPLLLEDFPFLHMSQHTWHELWRRGLTQIENITKAHQETKRKKSQSQTQIEEAVKRHEVLTSIVKKQMESMKRVREAKEQKKQQLQFKNKLHEKRQQSVRARKYYNEYAVRARSKLLRRRTKEEMIFKKLFKDGLTIQKDRIQEIRKYSREQREKQCKQRQNELDSMENYYHDQFEMLAAKVATERDDLLIREKAQQKALDQMKKELRKKMENEIQGYQDQLFRDDDDAYFRQLDADRTRQNLHLAKYQARI